MPRTGHEVRDRVDAGAVRHGCRVGDGILRGNVIDVVEVAQAHGEQVAVRDHHALGPARGAAGVEQPRGVVGGALFDVGQPVTFVDPRVTLGAVHVHHAVQPGELPRVGHDVRGDEGPARAGVLHDPLHFPEVQLGVDRHHHQPGPPGPEQQLQIARMVAHEQHHALAGLQSSRTQARAKTGGSLRPLGVGGDGPCATENGGRIGMFQRLALQQMGEVHNSVS